MNSTRSLAGVALLVVGMAMPAAGQVGVPARDSTSGGDAVSSRLRADTSALLDAPVDRVSYLLGPGDGVDVAIFGDLNRVYSLRVAPEGTLLIPGVGIVRVVGQNLDQAQARVREMVFRFFRNVDVRLSLAQVRSFKVFALGSVPAPGVRVATAATRVSEVIPTLTGDSIVRRNVRLRRASGDSLTIDLVRFLQLGDWSANPTLREGDALFVPVIDERVRVYGRVSFPGSYEYREGESLAELLILANGGRDFPSSAADTVRISRFVDRTRREFIALPREEAIGARGRALLLQPFDAVFVAEIGNFMQQKIAVIRGEVARPGAYPIQPDTTTVRDLVALAGGFLPDASLVNATLRRSGDADAEAARRRLQEIPPDALTREEQQVLQIRSQGDQTNVVIDFESLYQDGADVYNQTLQSGDVLTVPRRRNEVVVLGAVSQPGIVEYVPNRGIDYFVRSAGGFTSRADRGEILVLRAKLGTRIFANDVTSLDPGDEIVVPYKRRSTAAERLTTVQGALATVSGLVLTILGIVNLF